MKAEKTLARPVKKSQNKSKNPGSFSGPDLEASALAQMQEVERLGELLEDQQPSASKPPAVNYTVSLEDGKKVTACVEGNERKVLEWLFDNTYRVIGAQSAGGDYSTSLLETVRTILLSSAPKSPIESILITQVVASQHMVMRFSEKALYASDSEATTRFADRAARFMELSCRLAETIQKLRGGHQQKVVVEHVHVADGGQAVIGAVNTAGVPGEKADK